MAKLIYSMITSRDGYAEAAEGDLGTGAEDQEVHTFINDLFRPVGTYLYGRRMYETMVYRRHGRPPHPRGLGSRHTAPARRRCQDAAPHRTNGLDADQCRRTIPASETAPLTSVRNRREPEADVAGRFEYGAVGGVSAAAVGWSP